MKISRSSNFKYIPASHEDPNRPGSLKKVLFTNADFNPGQMQMLNWSLLPVGASFRKHLHEDMDEVFVIVKGAAKIKVGDEQDELGAGDAVLIPAMTPHVMTNSGSVELEYLAFGIATGVGGKTIVLED